MMRGDMSLRANGRCARKPPGRNPETDSERSQKKPGRRAHQPGAFDFLPCAASLSGRLPDCGRELDYLPPPLRRKPLHFRLETVRNVELNHLCHTILRSNARDSSFVTTLAYTQLP